MRALTMNEVDFVSGGYGEPNVDGGSGGTTTPWDNYVGVNFWSDVKKRVGGVIGGMIGGPIGTILGEMFADGRIAIDWNFQTTPGTGVCINPRTGDAIRNNDGNPLLACSGSNGTIGFSWGGR